jgi:hypothetical protein
MPAAKSFEMVCRRRREPAQAALLATNCLAREAFPG